MPAGLWQRVGARAWRTCMVHIVCGYERAVEERVGEGTSGPVIVRVREGRLERAGARRDWRRMSAGRQVGRRESKQAVE